MQDFIITAEKGEIGVHISQFNTYHDGNYATAEQARAVFGDSVDKWKCYDWILSFRLKEGRGSRFEVIRRAYVQYVAVVIDEGDDLELLAKKYCPHIGRESMLLFWTPGAE